MLPLKKVLIVQNHIAHYRIAFYQNLRKRCAENQISLELAYNPLPPAKKTNDYRSGILAQGDRLPWANPIPIRWLSKNIGWQPVWRQAQKADLVILQQELKYLSNNLLLLWRKTQGQRTAYWGHGRNFQSPPNSGKEAIKKPLSRLVDWWFSYTDLSTQTLLELPYPQKRITTLNNSVDTTLLRDTQTKTSPEDLQALRQKLNLPTKTVGLFTGGLHQFKRIEFLIEASRLIKTQCPQFHLLIIGDGPERNKIPNLPWITMLGAKTDEEKVPYWMLSHVLLMPGCVGLAAVDSLCLGTPTITTDYPYHSPEICYLTDKRNCLISKPYTCAQTFAQTTLSLLQNPELHLKLKKEGLKQSQKYSTEKMSEEFLKGIQSALQSPPLKKLDRLRTQYH